MNLSSPRSGEANLGNSTTSRGDASSTLSSPRIGTSKVRSVVALRKGAGENRDAVLMEKVLFEDDRKTTEFLKSLISVNGLRGAWSELQNRMQACEDLCVELMNTASPDALRQEFVTRLEYVKTVEGTHSAELEDHRERVERQEAHSAEQTSINDERANRLEDCRERLAAEEQGLASAQQELGRIEAQDLERHEAVLELHSSLKEQGLQRESALQTELRALTTRLRNEEVLRVALADEVASQKKFLYGEKLTQHVKVVLRSILDEYVRKEEMLEQARRAASTILEPVLADHKRFNKDVQETKMKNGERFEALEESVRKVSARQVDDKRDFHRRIDEVSARVDLCALKKAVQDSEAAMLARVKATESRIKEVNKAATSKYEELVSRLLEYQTILEDHEHALQHQAEELLNRCTKYDLILCQKRIDDCAVREKVEAELKELSNMVVWHSMKLEKLTLGQGLASSSSTRRLVKSISGQRVELTGEDVANSPHRSTSSPVDEGSTTELLGQVREQLERLAQGVLGLSHVAFRGVCQPAASREERQLREAEIIHHLSCILDWITHRKAPATWDPVKLTSLVMGVSVPGPGDFDRRRTPLHQLQQALARGASGTSASQTASADSSTQQHSTAAPAATPPGRRSARSGAQRSTASQEEDALAVPLDGRGNPDACGEKEAPGPSVEAVAPRFTQDALQHLAHRLQSVSPARGAKPAAPPTPRSPPSQASAHVCPQLSPVPSGSGNAPPQGPRGSTAATPRLGGGFRGHIGRRRISVPPGSRPTPEEPEPAVSSPSDALPPLVTPDGDQGGSKGDTA